MRQAENHGNAGIGLRVTLLGGFRVWVHGEEIQANAWRLQKARAIIKLLTLTPEHSLHRAEIIDHLWPEFDPDAGTNNLHRTLHAARTALRSISKQGLPSPSLKLNGQLVRLDPAGDLWIDVEAFLQASRDARGTDDPELFKRALALYTGELLPEDRYEDWTIELRETVRHERLTLLTSLAELYVANNDLSDGVAIREELVRADPYDEDAQVSLMRDLALLGQRGKALAQFHQLRAALNEIDVVPSERSERLYREILSRHYPPESGVPSPEQKTNLPAPLTSFVGRAVERVDLATLIGPSRDGPRLVTLIGPGGSGKTRLALTVAEDAIDRFSGGVWFVDFSTFGDNEALPNAIASALGIEEVAGKTVLDAIVDGLRGKQVLLVWDNCEHLLESCARLARLILLRAPSVRILATSRQPLDLHGEAIWRVPPLPVPEVFSTVDGIVSRDVVDDLAGNACVELFTERAKLVRSGFRLTIDNAAAVAQICRRLDGMPLALELAAARMGSMSAVALSERLDRALHVLASGGRAVSTRQRTLRGTLDWSHNLLSRRERVLFRRLAIFTGGWTLEMAEQICTGEGLAVPEVLELLADLIDKSLVRFDAAGPGERYRLLEIVRQYAEEQLVEGHEEETLRARHAEYFINLAEMAEPHLRGPEQTVWLDRLEHEYGNIRSAIQWLAGQGDVASALRLSNAIWWFCFLRGDYAEERERLLSLLEQADSSRIEVSPAIRAKSLLAAGALAWKREELPLARKLLEESVAIRRTMEDSAETAWSLCFLAHVAGSQGDFELGEVCALESLELFRASGEQAGMARALNALGEEARRRGEDDRAEAYYREGLEIDHLLGNRAGMALRLHNLGYVELHRDRRTDAAQSFFECLRLARELKDLDLVAASLEGVAAAASAVDARIAIRLFGAAERLRAELNVPIDIADQPEHQRFTALAQSCVSSTESENEWEAGLRLGLEESIDTAVSVVRRIAGAESLGSVSRFPQD